MQLVMAPTDPRMSPDLPDSLKYVQLMLIPCPFCLDLHLRMHSHLSILGILFPSSLHQIWNLGLFR
jgi:hypothetical protein